MTPLQYYKVYYLAEQFLNGDTGAPLYLWLLPLVLPGLCLAINQAGKCSLTGGPTYSLSLTSAPRRTPVG